MDELIYKIQMHKYYRDVETDMDYVVSLRKRPIDVYSRLHYVDSDLGETGRADEDIKTLGANNFHYHPSSLISGMPNESMEVDQIRNSLKM